MLFKIKIFFQKYSKWEFRPGNISDIPVYIYYLYLVIKSGSLFFFSNINPCMQFSGFSGTSKYDDLKKFNKSMTPQTIFIKYGEPITDILNKIKKSGMQYPLIAKPDLGRTGRDIMKLNNTDDAQSYLSYIKEDFLIQEFIDYPMEFGIFYYRFPDQNLGRISGITQKCFMFIKGDGKQKFSELVMNHPRARFYYRDLKLKYNKKRNDIIEKGKEIQLNYIGNHVRGSVFYDKSYLNNDKLEKVFDDLSKSLNGFYFGRYDIKVNNIQDLYTGNFKIIEVNGIGSLPVHNLDPDYGMINAYKEIFRHREIIYKISKINYKKGYKYLTIKQAREIIKKHGI
ncbi:MAG: hypothetical protein WAZ12_00540 [Candidatus Absconditicoccaceae bacterium]